jgi:hypothetical protein
MASTTSCRSSRTPSSVCDRRRCLSALRVSYSKLVVYGAFMWARRALNSPKRRFPARADDAVDHAFFRKQLNMVGSGVPACVHSTRQAPRHSNSAPI